MLKNKCYLFPWNSTEIIHHICVRSFGGRLPMPILKHFCKLRLGWLYQWCIKYQNPFSLELTEIC